MLDSALLTVFDDSIGTCLSDIAMISPVFSVDLHFPSAARVSSEEGEEELKSVTV